MARRKKQKSDFDLVDGGKQKEGYWNKELKVTTRTGGKGFSTSVTQSMTRGQLWRRNCLQTIFSLFCIAFILFCLALFSTWRQGDLGLYPWLAPLENILPPPPQ